MISSAAFPNVALSSPPNAPAQPLGQHLGGAPDVSGERQDGEDRGREYCDVVLRNQQFERDRERDEAERSARP